MQFCRDPLTEGVAIRSILNPKFSSVPKQRKSFADDGGASRLVGLGLVRGLVESLSVVADGDHQILISPAHTDFQCRFNNAAIQAMPNGVFDQRLKDEEWTRNHLGQHIRSNVPFKVNGVTEPNSLEFELLVHVVDFLRKRAEHPILGHEAQHQQPPKSTEYQACLFAFCTLK